MSTWKRYGKLGVWHMRTEDENGEPRALCGDTDPFSTLCTHVEDVTCEECKRKLRALECTGE